MPSSSSYRKYIQERHGSLYKITNEYSSRKRWRINRDIIRDTIIDEYKNCGIEPYYMITRTYHYEEYDRNAVQKDNKRINNVLNDFFNTRGIGKYHIDVDHFIERRKDGVKKSNPRKVKNTITNEYELDYEIEKKEGSYHVHSLVGYIDDEVILNPSKKIRDAIERQYSIGEIPISLRDDDGIERVKLDLMERAIRERSYFVGNSSSSLDITPTDEHGEYDGYRGWKGAVAYVTKQMYNADKIVEVYDHENSSILDLS